MEDHPSLEHEAGLASKHIQIDHAQEEISKEGKTQYQQIGKSQLHGVDVKKQWCKCPQPIVDIVKPKAEILPFWAGTNQAQAPLKQDNERKPQS